MFPFYLGLDLHKNNTYAVLIDQSGEVVDQRQFSNQETTKYLEEVVPRETYAVLARYNLKAPVGKIFGVTGREWLQEIFEEEVLSAAARRVIEDHLALIDHLDDHIEALEKDIALSDEQKQAIKLLKTMPGVGKIVATTIIAEVGDIQRFHSPKALCNWAGLTPRIRSSGGFTRYGHISKEGSPFLSGAMTRAATVASKISKRWYLVHETMLKRCGKKGAKVVVARRLLTVVYYMLKKKEPYQENYNQSVENRGT